MRADETNLLKFMNGPKQLIIPIYQRRYSWTLKECNQLWNDILKAGKDDSISGHFIGSVVYVEKGLYQVSSVPQLLVIDGQQRLTTISILLSAFSKALEKHESVCGMTAGKVTSYYLVNTEEEEELHHKLVLTKRDKETLFKIVGGKELPESFSQRLKDNYDFFKNEIEKNDIENVWNGISKLIIIDVSLDRERDNPQLIFESLNSTGLELTQADLIRNYILMGLEKKEQETLYTDYWFPMEKSFGHAEYSELFDRFMRDYLTIKTGKIPKIRDVYSAFKTYAQKFDKMEELVSEIYAFSKYFVNMALGKESDETLNNIFSDINTLKVNVSYPFLLKVYEDYDQEEITRDDFTEISKYVESYVFRRAICGIPTNSLNKTFANLYKEIKKETYLESFKASLLLKGAYRRFPKDEEFREQLSVKDVYNIGSRNYLLRKLENFNRKEPVSVESYTIEHIMPQNENLSEEWQEDLGENWKEIHEKYLHTLGNLTLTGYNPELSDKPFLNKRNMEGGFADSPIRLNRTLANLEKWNRGEILSRAKELTELASKIWQCPELNEETLNEYIDVGDEKPKSIYTLIDHPHLFEDAPMRPLFDELRKRILNLDSSVREEVWKLYITYKTTTHFVDITPQKSKLSLSLNMDFAEINDPREICKDVADKGRWGKVGISSFEDLDYIIFLVKQALDKVMEEQA